MAGKRPSHGNDPPTGGKPSRKRPGSAGGSSLPGFASGASRSRQELTFGRQGGASHAPHPSRGGQDGTTRQANPDHFVPAPEAGFARYGRNDSDVPQYVRDVTPGRPPIDGDHEFGARVEGDVRPTRGREIRETDDGGYEQRPITSTGRAKTGYDQDLQLHPDFAPQGVRESLLPKVKVDSFYAHAEADVAWHMRQAAARGEPYDGVIVEDSTPCGSRTFDMDRQRVCDSLLPGMLPPGRTLTVWSTVDGGQTFYRKVYEGTGVHIK
jgi:hypothetical protein